MSYFIMIPGLDISLNTRLVWPYLERKIPESVYLLMMTMNLEEEKRLLKFCNIFHQSYYFIH